MINTHYNGVTRNLINIHPNIIHPTKNKNKNNKFCLIILSLDLWRNKNVKEQMLVAMQLKI